MKKIYWSIHLIQSKWKKSIGRLISSNQNGKNLLVDSFDPINETNVKDDCLIEYYQ
jgi:hypothetical protein